MAANENESLISHLEALRSTLLKCLTALCIVLPFALFLAPKALDFIIKTMLSGQNIVLNYFSPTEVFLIQIKMGLLVDLIICFPYMARKIWNFILPALYENERKFIKSIVLTSSTLFVFGVLFCIFFILPLIVKFGISFMTPNIQAVFGISNVVSIALWLSLVFGLMFQMPLVTHSLIRFGIVERQTIAEKRPYVVVGLLILAAILTPPDIVSQIMLFIPTYLLFELGLLFSGNTKPKNKDTERVLEDK